MNSARFGVVGVADGKDSGKVPGPRKLEPTRKKVRQKAQIGRHVRWKGG